MRIIKTIFMFIIFHPNKQILEEGGGGAGIHLYIVDITNRK